MIQQVIALIIIVFFVLKLIYQKYKQTINSQEFVFWFIFWFLSAGLVAGIKKIDYLVYQIGFSSSGINVLLYLSVITLFYLIFKMRLKLEKINKNITTLTRKITFIENKIKNINNNPLTSHNKNQSH